MPVTSRTTILWALVMALTGALLPAYAAEDAASFYKDKTITMLVGFPPGGLNDLSARLVARFLAKHMPGKPRSIVQNMPGAGGLAESNYLYNIAPKDGTVIGGILRSIPQYAHLDSTNVRFESDKFTWLGSTSSFADDAYAMVIMADRNVTSWQDLKGGTKRIHLGAVGADIKLSFSMFAKDVLGLNLEITQGYPGAAQIFLAMQNGEADGQFNSMSSTRAAQRALWEAKRFRVLLQFGRLKRHPHLPDVPTGREVVDTPEDRALLAFLEAPLYMSMPFAAPPGIPADRAAALRAAFDAAHKDPELIAEAAKFELDVSPIDGAAVAKLVDELARTPPAVLARYKAISGLP